MNDSSEQNAKNKKRFIRIVFVIVGVVVIAVLVLLVRNGIVEGNKVKEEYYNEAKALMADGKIEDAVLIFNDIGNYKDSSSIIENAMIESMNESILNYEPFRLLRIEETPRMELRSDAYGKLWSFAEKQFKKLSDEDDGIRYKFHIYIDSDDVIYLVKTSEQSLYVNSTDLFAFPIRLEKGTAGFYEGEEYIPGGYTAEIIMGGGAVSVDLDFSDVSKHYLTLQIFDEDSGKFETEQVLVSE